MSRAECSGYITTDFVAKQCKRVERGCVDQDFLEYPIEECFIKSGLLYHYDDG